MRSMRFSHPAIQPVYLPMPEDGITLSRTFGLLRDKPSPYPDRCDRSSQARQDSPVPVEPRPFPPRPSRLIVSKTRCYTCEFGGTAMNIACKAARIASALALVAG